MTRSQIIQGDNGLETYEILVNPRYYVNRTWDVTKSASPPVLDIPRGGSASAQFVVGATVNDAVLTSSIRVAASIRLCALASRTFSYLPTATWRVLEDGTSNVLGTGTASYSRASVNISLAAGSCSSVWLFPVHITLTSLPTTALRIEAVLTPFATTPATVPLIFRGFTFGAPTSLPDPLEVKGTLICSFFDVFRLGRRFKVTLVFCLLQ